MFKWYSNKFLIHSCFSYKYINILIRYFFKEKGQISFAIKSFNIKERYSSKYCNCFLLICNFVFVFVFLWNRVINFHLYKLFRIYSYLIFKLFLLFCFCILIESILFLLWNMLLLLVGRKFVFIMYLITNYRIEKRFLQTLIKHYIFTLF